MSPDAIIAENARRRARLEAPYDPVTGAGSLLPRAPVVIHEGLTVRVPLPMFEHGAVQAVVEAGSMDALARCSDQTWRDIIPGFHLTRLRYDYEYWCHECVVIKNKQGQEVPFVLNPSQRLSVRDREAMRTNGMPVRQIELKHRQYGSTTEKNAYTAWVQNVLSPGVNAYVISLDRDGAVDIVERYDRIAKHYPPAVGAIAFAGVHGARNTKQVYYNGEPGGLLYLGSAEKPNAPSGRTVQVVLISEAGKMSSTAAKGADKLLTNIMSAVPMQPGTFVMVESTAESSGAWFKTEVEKAQNGKSGFRLTFISWMTDPQYAAALDSPDPIGLPPPARGLSGWVSRWNDYDRFLWEKGATLEQILWYQRKEREYQQPWQMKQEFPTTPEEAFQYGEKRVFLPLHVATLRKTCREPLAVGELRAEADAGDGAFKNIRFEPTPKGRLRIWRMPGDRFGSLIPAAAKVAFRYCAGSDVGGLWPGADFSCSTIGDRAPRLFGGMMEVAAEWHGHENADRYAWEIARLCWWYEQALWGLEINSMRARLREQRADFGLAVLSEIKDAYPNLYHREVYDAELQQPVRKSGWITNKDTKGLAIARLNAALRGFYEAMVEGKDTTEGLVERCHEATSEMDKYLEVEGSMEAAEGPDSHDDRVITRGILCYLDQDYMEPPRILLPREAPKRRPPSPAAL